MTWQRAECSGRSSTSCGVTREQTSIASGQRVTKRQPSAGSTAAEARPLCCSIRCACSFVARVGHGGEQQARVRMQRRRQDVLDRAALDDLAGVHDEDVVGDVTRARKIVRDVEEGDPALLFQPQHEVQDSDPDRDVEHADRLVGEDDLRLDGERARDRHALPLPARELVRVLRRDLARRNEADGVQQLVNPLVHLRGRNDAVDPQWSLDVVANRLRRVQRPERILEDHLHLRAVAKNFPPAPRARDIAAVEDDGTVAGVVQTSEQARDGCLSTPAFADERGDLPGMQLERDVVDRVHVLAPEPLADGESLREVPNLERSGRRGHRAPSSTRWHATSWPGSISSSRGRSLVCRAKSSAFSARQIAAARIEAAAGRRVAEVRRRAGDPDQARLGTGQRRERLQKRLRVRVLRARAEARGRRRLDDLSRVHDRDPVRELEQEREVVRDEEDRKPEVALECLDLLQDLALDDDVERGRRLVHHDELRPERERHRDDHALTHSARELVRVRACAPAVDADELEQLACSHERAPAVDALVRAHRVDELVADAHDRVERVHRALQHDRHVAPAEATQVLGALLEQVLALEQDAAARDPRGRTEDLHDGVRDRALATAGLTREADGLALENREVDAVHRPGGRFRRCRTRP